MGQASATTRYQLRFLFLVMVSALFFCLGSSAALAAVRFIPLTNRADVVYDDSRALLYVSAGDSVHRYDPETGAELAPVVLGGQLAGMDLSPDGNTLAVADATLNGVHLLDLDSGETSAVVFNGIGGGTRELAYDADGKLLITGTGESLVRYDPETTATPFPSHEWLRQHYIGPKAHIGASGDRRSIGIVSTDNWGHWQEYMAGDDTVNEHTTGWGWVAWSISGNADGSQFAICTNATVVLAQAGSNEFSVISTVTPFGLKFSPSTSSIFAPSYGSAEMLEYDADTGGVINRYDLDHTIGWNYDGAFYWPRLSVAADNSLVCVTVPGGIEIVRVRPRLRGTLCSQESGRPIPGAQIQVWRDLAGVWQEVATVPVAADGTWTYSDEDTSSVKLRAVDPSVMHDPMWYGGTSLASAAQIAPAFGVDRLEVSMPLTHPASVSGRVIRYYDASAISGVYALLLTADGEEIVDWQLTGADGRYSFPAVGPGTYRVWFEDSGLTYEPRYWTLSAAADTPGVLDIATPGVRTADATMDPVWVDLKFGRIRLSAGSTEYPYSGMPVSIETTLADSSAGTPMPYRKLALESSADGVTWVRQPSVPIQAKADGSYLATVAPVGTDQITYRFVVVDDSSYQDFTSDQIEIHPRGGSPFFTRPVVPNDYPEPVSPGESTRITVQLRNPDLTLLSSQRPRLMSSADGVNFSLSSAVASQIAEGTYAFDFAPGQPAYYRAVLLLPSGAELARSAAARVSVGSPGDELWTAPDVAPGSTGSSIGAVDAGGGVSIRSVLALPQVGVVVPASAVRVQVSSDGIVFTDVSAPGSWDAAGHAAYFFPRPLSRTYYRFVLAAGDEWDSAASPAAVVVPRPVLGKPKASSKVKRKRRFTVTGSVYPAHVGGFNVRVEIRRLQGRKWKLYRAYNANGASGTSAYRLAARIDKTGSYRITTAIAADTDHTARTSGYTSLRVR